MFKIFVLAMSVATGNPIGMFTSTVEYPSKEVCELARPASVEALKGYLDAQTPGGVDVQSKCDVEGTPS